MFCHLQTPRGRVEGAGDVDVRRQRNHRGRRPHGQRPRRCQRISVVCFVIDPCAVPREREREEEPFVTGEGTRAAPLSLASGSALLRGSDSPMKGLNMRLLQN